MKNKVKSGLLILNLVFLFSCGKSQITNVSTYIFTADKIISDSLVPVGFCQVILFLESGEIKDTISDIDGIYFHQEEVRGAVFRAANCYPDFKTKKELLKDSIVILGESVIMYETGGMGIDTLILEINTQIELMTKSWIKGNKNIERFKIWE